MTTAQDVLVDPLGCAIPPAADLPTLACALGSLLSKTTSADICAFIRRIPQRIEQICFFLKLQEINHEPLNTLRKEGLWDQVSRYPIISDMPGVLDLIDVLAIVDVPRDNDEVLDIADRYQLNSDILERRKPFFAMNERGRILCSLKGNTSHHYRFFPIEKIKAREAKPLAFENRDSAVYCMGAHNVVVHLDKWRLVEKWKVV